MAASEPGAAPEFLASSPFAEAEAKGNGDLAAATRSRERLDNLEKLSGLGYVGDEGEGAPAEAETLAQLRALGYAPSRADEQEETGSDGFFLGLGLIMREDFRNALLVPTRRELALFHFLFLR